METKRTRDDERGSLSVQKLVNNKRRHSDLRSGENVQKH